MGKVKFNGVAKLARVLDSRMGEHSAPGLLLDFGSIQTDGSLVADTFPVPIPKSDYSVCRLLAGLPVATEDHSFQGSLPKLRPGDRVLVAWVQQEPVVVDVVKKASGG